MTTSLLRCSVDFPPGLFKTTTRFAGLTFGVRANATAQTLLPFVTSEISDPSYSSKYELDVRMDGPGYQGALAVIFSVKTKSSH